MTVHLIGAGPGDAELMTIRAARLLANADAVVYDRLVGREVLDYVPATAERHPVGKAPGRPGPTQDRINRLLVDLGRRLETVVRVKGGDPFVFGRGIEEVAALNGAEVPVEVVPGISSALAGPTVAGISITERNVSSGFCVVTAHQDAASDPIDWSALARSGLTIVVLMGARRAGHVRDALMAGGMMGTTPTAVVTDATGPDQRVRVGSLADLGRRLVDAPSVIVVGPVAARAGAATDLVSRVGSRPVDARR